MFELPCPIGMKASPDWPNIMYSALPHSKLWPWVVTMRNLAETLTTELESASLALALVSTDTVREFCWALALAVMGNDDLCSTPIGIRELIEFMEKAEFRSHSVSNVYEGTFLMNYIETMRRYLLSRIEDSEDFIADPWPLPYQVTPSGRALNIYDSQKLLKRTKAVYEGALRIYKSMVDQWFNSFSHRLRFSAIMPVRLEGRLDAVGRGGSVRLGPVLSWYPRPLPADESSSVAFESGTPDGLKEEWQASLGEKPTFLVSEVLDVFGTLPATGLATKWLSNDLRALGWEK